MTKKKVFLGKITSTHGVKGLLKIQFYNNNSENLKNYTNKIYIDDLQVNLERKFDKGKLTICKIDRFKSKEEVSNILGKELWIEESSLEKKSDEYFHRDLINTKVFDKDNKLLGIVSAIHNFGAGDLLELNGKFKYMIRFYDLEKEDIDLNNKIIRLSQNYEI